MKTKRIHIPVEEMRKFTNKVLEAGGYSKDQAQATTYALLEADRRGIFSHGIAGGTGLEESVNRAGITSTVNLDAEPEIVEQKYPTMVVIDGKGAPGHYTAMKAVRLVKKLAREYGIAKVVVKNTNHYGAAGAWSIKIAEDGDLKGEVSCTTVACAKPMGDDPERRDYTKGAGTEVRTGTNPLAISFPHKDGILTLDMALTRMAISYCLKQLKAGEKLGFPEYIADSEYTSSLDPTDFVDSMEDLDNIKGSVFPHGSTLSGYKGDAQLRFLEIDQSLGGGPITKIPWRSTEERWISHSFEAQVIDFHYTIEEAKNRVRELMRDYEENYFGPNSRWPGDRADQARTYCDEYGIPYSSGQISTLKRAAEHVGLKFENIIDTTVEKEFPHHLFNK